MGVVVTHPCEHVSKSIFQYAIFYALLISLNLVDNEMSLPINLFPPKKKQTVKLHSVVFSINHIYQNNICLQHYIVTA